MGSTAAGLTNAELKAVIRKTDRTVTGLSVTPAANGDIIITSNYSSTVRSYSARVSFYPLASNFIGRVFPTSRGDVRTTGGSPANVGVTYGLYVDSIVKDVTLSAMSCTALSIASQFVGYKYRSRFSPVVISQGYGPSTSATVYELFKIIHRGHGTGTNQDVKVEISNIVFDDTKDYPNFLISVRAFDDTDSSPNYLESFSVNLNPDADDYILKVIGDRFTKIVTDEGATPFTKTYGNWDNKSDYIRIANPDSTEDAPVDGLPTVPSNVRPQGFKGLYMSGMVLNNSRGYAPTLELVTSQKRRTNRSDATATGDVSSKITLGWDFSRMDPSFLKPQNYFVGSTSAQALGTYATKGFYIKPSTTDATPSVRSYNIRDLTAGGSDVSSTLISGGSESNIRFALPLLAGTDGWQLNTDDTPQ